MLPISTKPRPLRILRSSARSSSGWVPPRRSAKRPDLPAPDPVPDQMQAMAGSVLVYPALHIRHT